MQVKRIAVSYGKENDSMQLPIHICMEMNIISIRSDGVDNNVNRAIQLRNDNYYSVKTESKSNKQ